MFLNERLKNIFLKNRDMRFIKMTGGLGNQMFIYAFYMRMKNITAIPGLIYPIWCTTKPITVMRCIGFSIFPQ